MRAVIYARVSTKEQTANLSLPTQQKACREYCSRQQLEVAAVFSEEGESAKTADRPELQRLLAFCRNHKGNVQCVVVYAVSRLAREKYDHFAIRSLLLKLGITLRSVTEPIDDSSTGKFIEGVLAASAQFDNDVRSERTRAGMRAAQELGHWTHQAPLGYSTGQKPGPKLRPHSDRAYLVRQAFEHRADGMSDFEVLRWLTSRGLTTRRGRPLTPQTLSALLRNPVYAGRIELPKWNFSGPGDWEPIVPRDSFLRVQKLRERPGGLAFTDDNTRTFRFESSSGVASALTPLTGSWSRGRNGRYAYYSCRCCGRVRVPKANMENLFLRRLEALQPDPGYMALLRAIVEDVWREDQRETAARRVEISEPASISSNDWISWRARLSGRSGSTRRRMTGRPPNFGSGPSYST